MAPDVIKSVETKTGGKRHILREGKRVDDPPSSWPICVCNYINMDEDSVQEHDSVDDIENLCENCRKRVINNGR